MIMATPDTGGSVAVRSHDQRGDRGEVARHWRSAVIRLFSEVFQPGVRHHMRHSRSRFWLLVVCAYYQIKERWQTKCKFWRTSPHVLGLEMGSYPANTILPVISIVLLIVIHLVKDVFIMPLMSILPGSSFAISLCAKGHHPPSKK